MAHPTIIPIPTLLSFEIYFVFVAFCSGILRTKIDLHYTTSIADIHVGEIYNFFSIFWGIYIREYISSYDI